MAALIAVSAAPARANLITNGSFETASPGADLPVVTGSKLPQSDTSISGWTVTGGLPTDDLAWLSNSNPYGPRTPFGFYFLDLTGFSDSGTYSGVTQTIATVAGQTYNLTFDLGVEQGFLTPAFNGPVGVRASAGATSFDFINFNPAGTGDIWGDFSLSFKADSATTTIAFLGLQGVQYVGLDNVAVEGLGSVSAVPLPASLPMFGAGLLSLAAFSYAAGRGKKTSLRDAHGSLSSLGIRWRVSGADHHRAG